MADQLPYCIHCGAQQLNADARFCHRCGRPIVPVKLGRRQLPPWAGPVLVSAVIVVAAAIVFARFLPRGPAAGQPAVVTPALAATTYTPTPAKPLPSPTVPAAQPTLEATPTRETPTPPPTETPQPTPTLANITPEPVKLTKMAWSPDGKLLAVGSGTGVYLYDTMTWQELRFIPVKVNIPPLPDNAPAELAFSFDSTMLAAAIGRAVQVWRVTDGVLAYTIQGVEPLAASPTEGLWATFPPFGTSEAAIAIHLWRTSDGQPVRTIPNNLLHPNTMVFSPDGGLLAVGSAPGDPPGVWQVADGRQVAQLNWPNAGRYYWQSVAFHPNATTVASAGSDIGMGVQNVFVLWDARRGAVIREIIGQGAPSQQANIRKVCYAPDGSLLAAYFGDYSGQENRVQLWSADGAAGRSWPLPGPASDISFTPDGKLLAVAEGERVAFYDPATGSLVRQMTPPWHQGILPTPTPAPDSVGLSAPTATSHAAALSIPIDWKAYDPPEGAFSIRYPPYWDIGGWGPENIEFVPGSYLDFDPASSLIVAIQLLESCAIDASSDEEMKRRLLQTEDAYLALLFGPGGYNDRTPLGSGRWTTLIQGFYAEFDITFEPGDSRVVRELRLLAVPTADHCVLAILLDDPGDISEQTRLDLAQVVGSIKYKDR